MREGPSGQDDTLTAEGRVVDTLPHAMFAVELTNGQRILSRLSGDLLTRGLRIVPGDRVTLQLYPYDHSRGRITRRHD
ncbi:MAG TPA: translation initiation factor IF-1 [Chloroflexota bacterium]|nr:translation initiation factor IF-1 [Chloroflexota bacterium]